MLRDMHPEGLVERAGEVEQPLERQVGRLVVAEGDMGRDEPPQCLGDDLGVTELLADRDCFGEHRVDLLVRACPARPVRRREQPTQGGAVCELTRDHRRLVSHERGSEVVALKVERAGQCAKDANAQLRLPTPDCVHSLLQQLDGALVVDRRSPARFLEPDRGPRQQVAVAEGASGRSRVAKGCECIERPPGAVARVAEIEADEAAFVPIVDTERECGAQSLDRLVERECGRGRVRSEEVVGDSLLVTADPRSLRVVVGQRSKPAASARRSRRLLEGAGDPQVQIRASRDRHPVRDRPADELVREAEDETGPCLLLHETAPHRLLHRGEDNLLRHAGCEPDGLELERGADHRTKCENVPRRRIEAGDSVAHDLAHGVGRSDLGDVPAESNGGRPDLDRAFIDEIAPELGQQEGVPGSQGTDCLHDITTGPAAGGELDELCHLVISQTL